MLNEGLKLHGKAEGLNSMSPISRSSSPTVCEKDASFLGDISESCDHLSLIACLEKCFDIFNRLYTLLDTPTHFEKVNVVSFIQYLEKVNRRLETFEVETYQEEVKPFDKQYDPSGVSGYFQSILDSESKEGLADKKVGESYRIDKKANDGIVGEIEFREIDRSKRETFDAICVFPEKRMYDCKVSAIIVYIIYFSQKRDLNFLMKQELLQQMHLYVEGKDAIQGYEKVQGDDDFLSDITDENKKLYQDIESALEKWHRFLDDFWKRCPDEQSVAISHRWFDEVDVAFSQIRVINTEEGALLPGREETEFSSSLNLGAPFI